MQIDEGCVPDIAVFTVETPSGGFNLVAKCAVGVDALAARRGDLHESDLARLELAVGEHLFVRLESVQNSLRVIEAIDPEHEGLRVAEFFTNLACPTPHLMPTCQPLDRLRIDGDRKLAGEHWPCGTVLLLCGHEH